MFVGHSLGLFASLLILWLQIQKASGQNLVNLAGKVLTKSGVPYYAPCSSPSGSAYAVTYTYGGANPVSVYTDSTGAYSFPGGVTSGILLNSI